MAGEKTNAVLEEKLLKFGIWRVLYWMFDDMLFALGKWDVSFREHTLAIVYWALWFMQQY